VRPGQDLLGEVQPEGQVVSILKREGLLDHPDVVGEELGLWQRLRLQSINQLQSFYASNEELQLVIIEEVRIEDL
jgi:hypothetical protein